MANVHTRAQVRHGSLLSNTPSTLTKVPYKALIPNRYLPSQQFPANPYPEEVWEGIHLAVPNGKVRLVSIVFGLLPRGEL